MNCTHMIGDHHGLAAGRATLLVRAVDGILGTHSVTVDHVTVYRWVQRFTPEFIEGGAVLPACSG
jgi:hypothetical protein